MSLIDKVSAKAQKAYRRGKQFVSNAICHAQRTVASAALFVLGIGTTLAQSKGAGGFTKAVTEISSYQTPVSNLMKAIGAVIAIVGAFSVYFKMQNGDQDVKKTIMLLLMKLNFRQRKIFKMI